MAFVAITAAAAAAAIIIIIIIIIISHSQQSATNQSRSQTSACTYPTITNFRQ